MLCKRCCQVEITGRNWYCPPCKELNRLEHNSKRFRGEEGKEKRVRGQNQEIGPIDPKWLSRNYNGQRTK